MVNKTKNGESGGGQKWITSANFDFILQFLIFACNQPLIPKLEMGKRRPFRLFRGYADNRNRITTEAYGLPQSGLVAHSILCQFKVSQHMSIARTPSFASFSRKIWHHLYYHSASPHSYCHPCRASPPSAVPASLNSSARATQPAILPPRLALASRVWHVFIALCLLCQPPSPTGGPHLLGKHNKNATSFV